MKPILATRQRFFLRRALKYFAIMMIPTLLVVVFSLYLSVASVDERIHQQGEQTLTAVETNFDQIIVNVFNQSNLLTSTVRISMALKHMTQENSITYVDTMFLSALGASLKSVVHSYAYMDSIIVYTNGATRCFLSDAGIMNISAMSDLVWLDSYQAMPSDISERIVLRDGVYGHKTLSFIKRMLLQDGCIIINVNAEKLEGMLNGLLTRPFETLVLLNAEGDVLLRTSNSTRESLTAQSVKALAQTAAESGSGWYTAEGGRQRVNLRPSGLITYCTMVEGRLMWEYFSASLLNILWLLLVDVAVVLILAYDVTRRSFHQITGLMDMFERARQNQPIAPSSEKYRDEYAMIMNNVVYMYLKQNQLYTQLQEQSYEREHSEFMALQLQINPHFLYNTLQTLEMEIRSGKSSRADESEMIRRISEILRYALDDPHQPVALEEELSYLRKYTAVQQYRFGDKFVLYYDADDGLEQARVFRLMLQPMVENCLIHGMQGMTERLYIEVNVTRADADSLRITVSDTGVGMDEGQVAALYKTIRDQNSRSIGLTNLNRRLLLRYGPQSELSITASPGKGTIVSFVIPCEMEG